MIMALMGLFVAFAIAYHLAKKYEMPTLNASIVSTAVFLIVTSPVVSAVPASVMAEGTAVTDLLGMAGNYIPTTFLDAKGIFTAIIVSIGCVEIMHFMLKKNIRFKMPEGYHQQLHLHLMHHAFICLCRCFLCTFIICTEYKW